jgi:carboxymethylenebutenolidase
MITHRNETISTGDEGTFTGHLAVPAAGHGPGVLVIQEIFGVNAYIRDVCERLASVGYVALAPDVFWRVEANVEFDSSDQANIEPAMQVAGRFDPVAGLGDLGDALEHLRSLEETQGATAAIGFCFGGTQAYRVAAHLDPACVVSYYGSGTADLLGDLDKVNCPVMFHFGDSDPYLPMEDVDRIVAATADRNDITVHVHQGGGHAFDNRFAPHFSQPAIAAAAWTETLAFLYTHIGGPGRGA